MSAAEGTLDAGSGLLGQEEEQIDEALAIIEKSFAELEG